MEIIALSKEWKQKADQLLEDKGLVSELSKYGDVHFTGAYAYDLMLHGDIDISITREHPYSIEEVFDIFKALYFSGTFRSYFISSDWDDPRKGEEFPEGYYVGLKEKINGERWKIDLWFLSNAEFAKREAKNTTVLSITEAQRELILLAKQYRNEHKTGVTGQQIYDAVLNGRIASADDVKNL